MTVVIYGAFFTVLAIVLSFALEIIAKKRIPQESRERHELIKTCRRAPFLGVLWIIIAFLIHVQISNRLAGQDCGLSGDPYVTLPNGYVLGALNSDDGYIVAPGYSTGVPFTGPGYVRGLIDLKWDGTVFLGTFFDADARPNYIRGFTFDTRDLSIHTFDSSLSWHQGDPPAGEQPDAYWRLLQQYRHHWPNYVFLALILAGEATIAVRLFRRWKSVHRVTEAITSSDLKPGSLLNL